MDPANPPPVGTSLTVSSFDLIDQNDDDDVDRFNGDSVDGVDVIRSWPGDTVTVNVPGVGNVTYVGTTFYLADGREVFTPTDGQVLQDGTFQSASFVTTQGPLDVGELGPVCFTLGTLIRTPGGDVSVENLRAGDLIVTRDGGSKPIEWIGSRTLSVAELAADPSLRPVRIKAGALGEGVPSSDLIVSQQHRVLVRSKIAERMFGEHEILVAAKHLCQLEGIEIVDDAREVRYFHILFDRHEVIFSNGAETESLFVGTVALRSLDRAALGEVLKLFPDLAAFQQSKEPARAFVPGRLGRKLASRHAQNEKPLVM